MAITITSADAGCWVDSSWGHYGPTRLVYLANSLGFPLTDNEQGALAAYDDGRDQELVGEMIQDASERAEVWLNENAAPAGYWFGWHDGDFMLWSNESWEDQ